MLELIDFLDSPKKSAWVRVGFIDLYVRKSSRNLFLRGKLVKVFDLANVLVDSEKQGCGVFTAALGEIERLIQSRNVFEGIYVESVQTQRLCDFFLKRGYLQVGDNFGSQNFVHIFCADKEGVV